MLLPLTVPLTMPLVVVAVFSEEEEVVAVVEVEVAVSDDAFAVDPLCHGWWRRVVVVAAIGLGQGWPQPRSVRDEVGQSRQYRYPPTSACCLLCGREEVEGRMGKGSYKKLGGAMMVG
jgi:hypothetical protein